ncbi:transcriptional regulator [Paraburkholderia fungorum]|uniref:helix-turn-helix domain-containing protein n=1 Tax=Paraburkholderia fungorum TaxID=134537 RepID=UPI0005A7BAA9|nr:helix-turn-helix transcriptional regulator [Paraburkholderia fungorum]MBB5547467.1 transcriptional regulator with XRE-family HTH domain [Paraburkholderia fungorum]PNE59780.1 transcriptional regulator [Paraburkholderia fungorum]
MLSSIMHTIDAARKSMKLRQEDLAARTGFSVPTVQRALSGVIDPRLSTVEEIARGVGMDLVLVPTELRPALENFIRSGGRYLAQPPGTDAPPSVIDLMMRDQASSTDKEGNNR